MTHSWWWLIVDALAVYRLTVLLVDDMIMQPFREWVLSHKSRGKAGLYSSTLITCPWCVSVWIGACAVALTKWWPCAWQYVAAALTFSAVAGFLSERTDH